VSRVVVLHWKPEEAEERAERVRKAGHDATALIGNSGDDLRELRADPPDAVVIDLSRLPSHGRASAIFLRQQKATREVPLVFVGGEGEKLDAIRALLPDATYTSWRGIAGALKRALAKKPEKPVVPQTMAGYSGTPLPKKLGIAAGARVALEGAPEGFESLLGQLPAGVRVQRGLRGAPRVALVFVRGAADLPRRFERAANAVAEGAKLWIVWPKRTSSLASDVNENAVRDHGLAHGWVDYKVCAVDETWSGLCFAKRK
jgi:hypothetical protein